MSDIRIGHAVPDFSAAATGGQTLSLSQFHGQPVVLYFYPKDNTPGCTQESQDFRDHYAEFQALNAVILGISRDSVKSHDGFKTKHCFPFELLSDADEALCGLFDVIKPKNMYGKQVRGIERSTFLIGRDGKLAAEWRKVKVEGHWEAVLAAVKSLSK
ncbi:MAG: peroxiredoxin [Methylococcaceae bacterium]|nr:MAG: peroxiredoxin [Methylococcaceae bacterium]